MEQIRSFIAIELPDQLKLALKRLQEDLKRGDQHGVKWVDPVSIHLTLKFLGSVHFDRINDIMGAMERSARGIAPFHLEMGNPGAFPNLKRPRVVWVGLGGEVEPLNQLQKRIEANLVPLGFAAEERFSPHLTLARVRDTASPEERQRLGELIAATKCEVACSIAVDSISLMRSELTPRGAVYTRLGSVSLPVP